MKEWMDFIMNALRGRVSSDFDELVHQTNFFYRTRHFVPPSIEISYATIRNL